MSNNFFNDHPMLGSIFDSNRDGSLDANEFGPMAAFGAMYANETLKATKQAERESRDYSWEDDYRDHDDDFRDYSR